MKTRALGKLRWPWSLWVGTNQLVVLSGLCPGEGLPASSWLVAFPGTSTMTQREKPGVVCFQHTPMCTLARQEATMALQRVAGDVRDRWRRHTRHHSRPWGLESSSRESPAGLQAVTPVSKDLCPSVSVHPDNAHLCESLFPQGGGRAMTGGLCHHSWAPWQQVVAKDC